jgi:hypothetical protein
MKEKTGGKVTRRRTRLIREKNKPESTNKVIPRSMPISIRGGEMEASSQLIYGLNDQ